MEDIKTEEAKVNEAALMDIISEGEPDYHKKRVEKKSRQPEEIPSVMQSSRIDAEVTPASAATIKNPSKRAKDQPDYRSMYLVNTTVPSTYQTYILPELYCYVRRVLPAIAPGVSITGYINNILLHHMKQHQDFINEMYTESCACPPRF